MGMQTLEHPLSFLPHLHPWSMLATRYAGDSPKTDVPASMLEIQMTLIGAMEGLMAKTGLLSKDVDILVTV
jgi:hypothetical protein